MPIKNPRFMAGFTPLENGTVREPRSLTGFTLLEVLVAMLILTVVIGGVFTSFMAARNWASKAKNRLAAVAFSIQTLENLGNCVTADSANPIYNYPAGMGWGLQSGSHTDPLPANCELVARFGGSRTFEVTDIANGMKQVTVRVKWTQ